MSNQLARFTDWLQGVQERRRIEYLRAKLARPDYGGSDPPFEWALMLDGLLANTLVLLRALEVVWGGVIAIGILLCLYIVYWLYKIFPIFPPIF